MLEGAAFQRWNPAFVMCFCFSALVVLMKTADVRSTGIDWTILWLSIMLRGWGLVLALTRTLELYISLYIIEHLRSQDRELIYSVSKHICHFSPALATKYELQNKRKTHKQDFKMVVSISGESEMLISIGNDMLVVFAVSEWSFPFIQKQTEN